MSQEPKAGATGTTNSNSPITEDPGELMARRAEEAARHWEAKTAAKTAKKQGKGGLGHIHLFFLSLTKAGHACMHIVHDNLGPLKMAGCEICDAQHVHESHVSAYVGNNFGVGAFNVLPVEGHKDHYVVHVMDGHPNLDGHQIYPVDLAAVVPKGSKTPLHQAIWGVVENLKAMTINRPKAVEGVA